ncbi:zinc finger MYM-type protein 2 isoform X1 [Aquila chrysaetos chrysaetos]|uniref:zinc finger MYM-type protein 2 isoform X1 n=1 Tax=Aquila chrysaetos chrysaetos TaxID=223781 RepID=UPI001176B574|nr:zinc finger MYM-type protein 2 isoform X1 [Aquila chrysaetos chrysaetos]XP_029898334.1 zinc finger MYM-type protein 2 isoform X1 [Aquila chrysaetos chrysaetos]XP_029898335.1 zinc finger MYM-type protein 2 isoform X1 [Aquila chrysaetos chrysaetos]XP_029898336.1 zinc finger MYM-type protein 2 isoform X1 [Aquila chrysaetos chrysaetos]XP_029898337.1 zinc finger MYM-type protein 2 isoform X1 [Aquila chrysaetos chrysaetos]XP_029898338.1 zinc finger MYM-type protein 2 isoform X1 [Aquila chrysaetos
MDTSPLGGLELSEHTPGLLGNTTMAAGLANVGNTFGGPPSSLVSRPNKFQNSPIEDDDDVVFIEPIQPPQNSASLIADQRNIAFTSSKNEELQGNDCKMLPPPKDLNSQKGSVSETIIIDDEEDIETNQGQEKNASSFNERRLPECKNRANDMEFSASSFSRSKVNSGIGNSGITTEPDSEIQIANVTTLETGAMSSVSDGHLENAERRDMNLMITHVTSLQNANLGDVSNGLQSSNFGVNMQTYTPSLTSQTKTGVGPFNPGRMNVAGDVFQNGESVTHHNPDSWISQSASFPRNQKQPGVDSLSPVASLPKQIFQPSAQQQPSKQVKVTCANCKKPLQKGQTAYQRKGSAHLFCSTTCLSSFSHKPTPKKLCVMCRKDITTMKGTIVAQVDSSESFQEFCSTSCLSFYEDKQNPSKGVLNKSRCTICGKLTEIRHEVSFKNMTHKLCSDHCFNRYRMANGLIMNCCEHCGEYLPSKGAGNNILTIDGQQKRFCCQNCVGEYKQKYGKLTSCTGCRAQCRFFDMTQCIGPNGYMEPYCSTACMNTHKSKYAKSQSMGIICHFCKRNSLPQYQATMPDGKLYNFCSSSCVAKFQTLSVQSSTNGQFVSPSDIQLKCNYCKSSFCSKPEVLEWENKVYQFCSRACSDDYKKLHCIVTYCEYCQEEKTLHETVNFSGIKRPFCSEGCKLLYKQDFARRLGLRCVTCNYCSQLCKKGATKELDGVVRDFCSEECCKKFQDWYYKAARCDCCKSQGTLKEKVQWRGEMKHFCDQHCLLRFYCQQNEPNLATQKGPENLHYDQGCQTPRTKITGSAPPPSPTPNREMKNKAVLCKPLTMTKATYCKPHMQTKSCQTEDDWKKEYVPVPIPVPVYVPVPMNMYSQNVPVPTMVPVPVPVPVFLPTTLDSSEKILAAIEELRGKVPSNPLETELLNLSGMVPEHDGKAEVSEVASVIVESNLLNSETEARTSLPDVPYEPDLDIEIDFPRATEELDTENEFLLPPVFGEEYEEQPRPRSKKKGVKRKAVSEYQSHDDSSENSECSFPFKYTYGVNAWKHWVKSRYLDEELPELEELKSTKSVKLKEDLLSHTSAELNYGLTHFVNEIRRPNGENYAPDSIYYLCLGIQEYLYGSNRKDNIFIDPIYQTFEQELNKILRSWQPSILPDGSIFSRVEEDYLWRIKQLGSHSPVALLNTLFYFNTKYFGLKTVEQHLRLSFGTVFRQWKKNPLTMESKACLRYQVSSLCRADSEDKITTGKRKHEDDEPVFEQIENTSDPARCPVKMFECYLSKSPQNLNQRTDMFYLQPECSVSAESPIWYTATSLDRSTLENMLVRVLLVKDIYDKDNYELDEDID